LANLSSLGEGGFGGSYPVVAIIDSGVDYNHPAIHDSLWLNPIYWQDPDGRKDRYGWDFISEDAHPFDDGYHGTQVASVILGVAPQVKIMPLKIFNPWGVTNSASIYGAFTYAVDHGAQIIVCAWATTKSSISFSMGVEYARAHGVAVIAGAGDDGMSLTFLPYYPAVLSEKFDNVLTVTAVDSNDRLMSSGIRKSNYDPNSILLAAPGVDIPVAEPRNSVNQDSSTGLATAMVAGALARYLEPNENYQHWMSELLQDADSIPSLESAVKGGLRLHVKR
jgi:thermitase